MITFFRNALANANSGTFETNAGGQGRTAGLNFQCSVSGVGALTAIFNIYGSNVRSNSGGVLLATVTLAGTGVAIDGVSVPAKWRYLYMVLSNLTGTGAIATAIGNNQ